MCTHTSVRQLGGCCWDCYKNNNNNNNIATQCRMFYFSSSIHIQMCLHVFVYSHWCTCTPMYTFVRLYVCNVAHRNRWKLESKCLRANAFIFQHSSKIHRCVCICVSVFADVFVSFCSLALFQSAYVRVYEFVPTTIHASSTITIIINETCIISFNSYYVSQYFFDVIVVVVVVIPFCPLPLSL